MTDRNSDSPEEIYRDESRFFLPYTPNFEFVETIERALEVVEELKKFSILAVDTETTGLDPYKCRLLLLQIATTEKCYILNCVKVNPEIWAPILSDENILKILQNAKFDYKFLKVHANVSMRHIFDTMIAERLITVGLQNRVSLQYMAMKYLGMELNKEIRKDFVGVYRDKFSRSELLYAANDALILHEIYNIQIDALQRDNLITVALLEFKSVIPFAEMELSGVLIDQTKWKTLLQVAKKNLDTVESQINSMLLPVCSQLTIFGESTVNISSPQQLLGHLHKLGVQIPDTSDESLQDSEHEVCKLLIKWRHWNTVLKRYGEKFLSKIDKKTGRLYAQFNQVRAVTGRTSSDSPNLQQVPGFDPEDPDSLNFRSCFVAPKGYKIVGADYSNQELRILAEVSNESNMLSAFMKDADIHMNTACLVYNKDEKDVTKTERKKSKVTGFTIVYGGSAFTISKRLGIPKEEAEDILNAYFRAYPKVRDYITRSGNFAIENGYSASISGRRRNYRIPKLNDSEYDKKIGAIKRQAANARIQSAAADVSKQGMCNFFYSLEKTGLEAKLIAFVHDEILVQAKEEDAEQVAKLLEESMISGFSDFFRKIPMRVDASISNCWDH